MNSHDLAFYAVDFGIAADLPSDLLTALKERILGPGKEQYEYVNSLGETRQRFQDMSEESVLEGLQEELEDAINYCIMMIINRPSSEQEMTLVMRDLGTLWRAVEGIKTRYA